ncbi:MAG: ATP-binding cassette domain-containing protein [Thermodesulfobacteriota bacterium]
MTPVLELQGIYKDYGAVRALSGVDLTVRLGEVLALCGDNGAGKSTLIKIVSGAETATTGEMRLNGETVHFASPAEALRRGVATIYQDLALAPRLQVYQNVFMGAELLKNTPLPGLKLLDKKAMKAAAAGYLGRLNIVIQDLDAPVAELSGGQRQAVAICRALRWNAQVVIMDEPTAALGVKETTQVLDLIRQLHDQGVTILIISHNMKDVLAVATRVAILKNGRKVGECLTDDLTSEELATMVMTGNLGARNILPDK